jgi:hypothetical protein
MGAARSSNSATAITNVSNMVSNSTSANVDQTSHISNGLTLDHCDINLSGDFIVNTIADVQQSSKQFVTANQTANLNNNLSQVIQQTAASTVGALGIGYAEANNSVSATVNSSNRVINNMNATAISNSNISNEFNCNRSTIRAKNIIVDFNSQVNFLTDQVVNNTQNSDITNTITQSITQKATATVEGIGSLILALLLLVAVILYGAGKVLDNGATNVAISIGLIVLIVLIIAYQYLNSTPPFFAPPLSCVNNSAMGRGTGSNIPDCIEMTQKPLQLNSPPQRYTYPILPGGLPSNVGGNLVQMSIAANSGQTINSMGSNGGYRGDTFNVLQSRIAIYNDEAATLKIPNIPNPLKILERSGSSTAIDGGKYYAIPQEYLQGTSVSGSKLAICTPGIIQVGSVSNSTSLDNCPSIASPEAFEKTSDTTKAVANLNIKDWNDYLGLNTESTYGAKVKGYIGEDEAIVRALFARFVLCDLIGNIDLNTCVYDKEYIKYMDDNNKQIIKLVSTASNDNSKNHIYKYKSLAGNTNYVNGFTGAGTINGYIGVIDNKQYRFQKFMRSYGFYIIIAILGLIFLYSVGSTFFKKSKPAEQPSE